MKQILILIVILCATAAFTAPAHAAHGVDKELLKQANVVAEVHVIHSQQSAVTNTVYYTVQIDRCTTGNLSTSYLLVRVPARRAKTITNGHKLDVGQRATLYLKTDPQGKRKSQTVLGLIPRHGNSTH